MSNQQTLYNQLLALDGRGYKAYQDIKGSYQFRDFTLIIHHVQGDPFASPSKIILKIPASVAQFPPNLYQSLDRAIGLEDYLIRQFDQVARQISSHRGTRKSGLIAIVSVGQEILKRTAAFVREGNLEIRFFVGLPARGRTILGRQAAQMLCEDIPEIVDRALKYSALNPEALQKQVETVEDADWLRQELVKRGLVAFVANGSILPRRSGVDARPLETEAIPFKSPKSLEVSFNCPNRGLIEGMAIPQGITLIVGGGYHGKSTLLRALELGVYNHIPGDGREFVISDLTGVKIRAEDGRSIVGVNISPFINQLPQGRSTDKFSTTNASGSTSQAANIIEALEVGAKVLFIDEDTAATNFMIRDRRMQQLITKEKEPITPLIDKISQLYTEYGVSTILVMGGSGDYFEVADTVIAMDNFQPEEVTKQAKLIAKQHLNDRLWEGGTTFGEITPRMPLSESIDPSRGRKAVKVKVRDIDEVGFGTEEIDLTAVEQIVETGQLRAIAAALVYAKHTYMKPLKIPPNPPSKGGNIDPFQKGGNIDPETKAPLIEGGWGDQLLTEQYWDQCTLSEILDLVMADIESQGLDCISEFPQGDLVFFRRFELAAALNRLRSLKVSTNSGS